MHGSKGRAGRILVHLYHEPVSTMDHQLLLKNGVELCQYLVLWENCMEACLPNILW